MLRKLLFIICVFLAFNVFADISSDTLLYINNFRAAHGLAKLEVDNRICNVANKHSVDMARHLLPIGHDGFSQRMEILRKLIPHSGGGAENVAYNYKSAEAVVDGWINSPGHRNNILGNYNLTCIAVALDKEGKIYYTQMFLQS